MYTAGQNGNLVMHCKRKSKWMKVKLSSLSFAHTEIVHHFYGKNGMELKWNSSSSAGREKRLNINDVRLLLLCNVLWLHYCVGMLSRRSSICNCPHFCCCCSSTSSSSSSASASYSTAMCGILFECTFYDGVVGWLSLLLYSLLPVEKKKTATKALLKWMFCIVRTHFFTAIEMEHFRYNVDRIMNGSDGDFYPL